MAAVILARPGNRKILCVCISYQEAKEWAEAHNFCFTEGGVTFPLVVEDRYY
jgi:hypothetical protein